MSSKPRFHARASGILDFPSATSEVLSFHFPALRLMGCVVCIGGKVIAIWKNLGGREATAIVDAKVSTWGLLELPQGLTSFVHVCLINASCHNITVLHCPVPERSSRRHGPRILPLSSGILHFLHAGVNRTVLLLFGWTPVTCECSLMLWNTTPRPRRYDNITQNITVHSYSHTGCSRRPNADSEMVLSGV